MGEYQNDGGYVQILNAEDVEGGQETQQVIYLYPEELSYYTITLAENQDALEVNTRFRLNTVIRRA